jgi:DNA-binding XRE family transcriptional regulator
MTVSLEDKFAQLSPERLARIERRAAELREEEMTLRELRKAHALTQTAIAGKLRIKQASVARMEQRSDLLLSTLRSYIRAMGGELELVARLPNRKPVRLREIGDLEGGRAASEP